MWTLKNQNEQKKNIQKRTKGMGTRREGEGAGEPGKGNAGSDIVMSSHGDR